MKKLKKKLSYVVKTIMAVGLLFTNVLPFSTVLAEGLDDYLGEPEVTENGGNNLEEENKDGELLKAPEENENEGENTPGVDEEENLMKAPGEGTAGEGTTGGDETTPATTEDPTETPSENPPAEDPTTDPAADETPSEAAEASFLYEVYVDGAKYNDDGGLVELEKTTEKLEIIAKLSGAEATESYTFVIDGNSYNTEDLLNGVVVRSLTFPGYLYGVFNLELDGTLINPDGSDEERWYNYVVEYGTDADNDEALSAVNSDYIFKEGVVTTTKYDEETLRKIVTDTFPKAVIEDLTDDELVISDDHGMFAWYGIVTKGDINGDGKIDEEDLELLIKQVLGEEEATEESDINGDGEVNDLDAVELKNMLESGFTEEVTEVEDVTIDAKFGDFSGPVKVGDEFSLEYIVTLNEYTVNGISGLVNYDKDLLELVGAEASKFDLGDIKDGNFLYLGDYLDLDIEPEYDENGEIVLDENGMPVLNFNDVEYVLIKLTFKALKAGTAGVSVDGVKFFDWSYYYSANGVTSIGIVIKEDNPFSSISVSGYNVDLDSYTVTVPEDVTDVNVEYALNDGYEVTSIAAPEELAIGENTVSITVVGPDGTEKTYTITVTREGASDNTSNVTPMNYTDDDSYDDGGNVEPDVTPVPSDDDDKKVEPSDDEDETTKKANNVSRIIIIILILLAIAGLIYLIFKDEDDEETKKANKEIDKMKKADDEKVTTKKVDNNKKPKKKER
ncbi:MAG: cadherin-like beta sandwich domain-containing protein [Bacilli bacterium]|nr:cadherin-like beta sandwich domain-containing protein [Bacilli bacterium]